MSDSISRQKFESWFCKRHEVQPSSQLLERKENGQYLYCTARESFEIWQASRDYAAVELPSLPAIPEPDDFAIDDSRMDGYNAAKRMRNQCERVIENAGIAIRVRVF